MKKIYALTLAAVLLSACSSVQELPASISSTFSGTQTYRLANSHWSDVAKIRAEAQRLGVQVRAGQLTKAQAAQYLNRFRINLVGHNEVDDSMYEVYQRATVENQRGVIDGTQLRAAVENALRGWQQRWPNMQNKPNNPAFTNFLLEFMNMKPLQ